MSVKEPADRMLSTPCGFFCVLVVVVVVVDTQLLVANIFEVSLLLVDDIPPGLEFKLALLLNEWCMMGWWLVGWDGGIGGWPIAWMQTALFGFFVWMNSEFLIKFLSTFMCLTLVTKSELVWPSLFTFVDEEDKRSNDCVSTALSTPSGLISLVTLNLLYLPIFFKIF
jgi:hypothetical protein